MFEHMGHVLFIKMVSPIDVVLSGLHFALSLENTADFAGYRARLSGAVFRV